MCIYSGFDSVVEETYAFNSAWAVQTLITRMCCLPKNSAIATKEQDLHQTDVQLKRQGIYLQLKLHPLSFWVFLGILAACVWGCWCFSNTRLLPLYDGSLEVRSSKGQVRLFLTIMRKPNWINWVWVIESHCVYWMFTYLKDAKKQFFAQRTTIIEFRASWTVEQFFIGIQWHRNLQIQTSVAASLPLRCTHCFLPVGKQHCLMTF